MITINCFSIFILSGVVCQWIFLIFVNNHLCDIWSDLVTNKKVVQNRHGLHSQVLFGWGAVQGQDKEEVMFGEERPSAGRDILKKIQPLHGDRSGLPVGVRTPANLDISTMSGRCGSFQPKCRGSWTR